MDNNGRRKFLGICLAGTTLATVAAALYPVFRYLAPMSAQQGAAKLTFSLAEIPEGEAKFFEYAGASAVLVHSKGQVIGLSAVCTHLGCVVQWEKAQQDFLCPCHAGRYAPDGTVIAGPPPKPLPKIPVAVAGDKIIVG